MSKDPTPPNTISDQTWLSLQGRAQQANSVTTREAVQRGRNSEAQRANAKKS